MSQSLLYAAVLLAGGSLLISSAAGAPAICTSAPATPTIVNCVGEAGLWPLPADANAFPIANPATVTELHLTDMGFATGSTAGAPLPATLTALTKLVITNSLGVVFPFAALIAGLPSKEKITNLQFHKVNLQTLTKEHLAGLTGLQELDLDNCSLSTIDPSSLQAATGFKSLIVQNEATLTTLPAAVLTPVAASLTTVSLLNLPMLTVITPTTTPAPTPLLRGIMIMNTGLVSVPDAVNGALMSSLNTHEVDMIFVGNKNPCSDCNILKPIVAWAKTPATHVASKLTVSCQPAAGSPQVAPATGTSVQWRAKADCPPFADMPPVTPTTPSAGAAVTSMWAFCLLSCIFAMHKLFL